MTKTIKSFLVLFSVLGLLAGCSSNTTQDGGEESSANESAATTNGAGDEASLTESSMENTVEDALANVDTVFYFEFDQSLLNDAARAALLIHAEALTASPRSIRLEGHADERGSREYNMALGERRANAVRDFLVLQGVDAGLIETVSYGEEQPASGGSYESAWSENRRVELK